MISRFGRSTIRATLVAVLALAVFGVLSGCRSKGPYRTALLGTPMKTLDPTGLNEINELTFAAQICGRLTAADEFLNIEGDLADHWDISNNGKIYTFSLKKVRHFSDGRAVSAEDVMFSIRRLAKDPHSLVAEWAKELVDLSVVEGGSVRIELKTPDPRFLFNLSSPRFCVLNKDEPFYKVDDFSFPNSPGAYRISGFEKSANEFAMTVTPDFRDLAVEKEIRVAFLTQDKAVAEFQNGRLNDLSFYLLEPVEVSQVKGMSKLLRARLYWTWYIYFNLKKGQFVDLKRREMFSERFDRSQFISDWGSDVKAGSSLIPYGMKGYFEIRGSSGRRVKVKETQKKDKFCIGPVKIASIDGMPNQASLGQALKKEVERVTGCPAVVVFLDMTAFMKEKKKASFDIYVVGIDSNSNDSLGFYLDFHSESAANFLGSNSKEFDKTFDRIYAVPQELRTQENFADIARVFDSNHFGLPVGYPEFTFVYSKDVTDMHMNPTGMHQNRWWKIGRR